MDPCSTVSTGLKMLPGAGNKDECKLKQRVKVRINDSQIMCTKKQQDWLEKCTDERNTFCLEFEPFLWTCQPLQTQSNLQQCYTNCKINSTSHVQQQCDKSIKNKLGGSYVKCTIKLKFWLSHSRISLWHLQTLTLNCEESKAYFSEATITN